MHRYLVKKISPTPTRGELAAVFIEARDPQAAEFAAAARHGGQWRALREVTDREMREARAEVVLGPFGA